VCKNGILPKTQEQQKQQKQQEQQEQQQQQHRQSFQIGNELKTKTNNAFSSVYFPRSISKYRLPGIPF
jgi:hypothetical protein